MGVLVNQPTLVGCGHSYWLLDLHGCAHGWPHSAWSSLDCACPFTVEQICWLGADAHLSPSITACCQPDQATGIMTRSCMHMQCRRVECRIDLELPVHNLVCPHVAGIRPKGGLCTQCTCRVWLGGSISGTTAHKAPWILCSLTHPMAMTAYYCATHRCWWPSGHSVQRHVLGGSDLAAPLHTAAQLLQLVGCGFGAQHTAMQPSTQTASGQHTWG